MRNKLLTAAVFFLAAYAVHAQRALAPTPPMGWNSWDSYGLTVDESQFRANMVVLSAQLKEFGWQYVVVDEGWYLQNPESAATPERLRYTLNAQGQYEPALGRFPTSEHGAGFKPLADAAHADGLKFGIHIIRGIPKKTVEANTRIGVTRFRAVAAADSSDTCPWNPDNYGVKDNAAGQAWYDALIKQYAAWGIDYLKVDCIASHPYKADEIRMIHRAILRSGRAIVLSLSPGPASLEDAADLQKNAQLWRISDDVWDRWDKEKEQTGGFPQSVKDQFAVIASWAKYVRPGSWPDADMLPIGQLQPVPGYGKPRASGLTPEEQRTMITLWAIARSPLFVGGNLTQMDDAMKSLLTNPGVLAVDQHSTEAHPILTRIPDLTAWVSTSTTDEARYLAVFNTGNSPIHIDRTLAEFGFIDRAQYRVRDLWMRKELGILNAFTADIPAHGAILLSLRE
ncbi:MAG: glycoside hydrolase family 27 protein [Acidobacteriota bacterium]|nr:glycoside hydrolase family 27 protein [Acidobacteriota bacterium]